MDGDCWLCGLEVDGVEEGVYFRVLGDVNEFRQILHVTCKVALDMIQAVRQRHLSAFRASNTCAHRSFRSLASCYIGYLIRATRPSNLPYQLSLLEEAGNAALALFGRGLSLCRGCWRCGRGLELFGLGLFFGEGLPYRFFLGNWMESVFTENEM